MNKDGRYRGDGDEIVDREREHRIKAQLSDEFSGQESAFRKSVCRQGFADFSPTKEMLYAMARNNDEDTLMHK